MHDLGSAQQLPARPQTVTPGSTRGPTLIVQAQAEMRAWAVPTSYPPGP